MSDKLSGFQLFIGHSDEKFLDKIVPLLPDRCKVYTESKNDKIVNDLLELQPDLAILDYYISEIEVIELCEKISGDYPSSNIVICVNIDDLQLAKKKWRMRAMDYIVFPVDEVQFVEAVNKVIRYVIMDRERNDLIRERIEFRYAVNNGFYEIKEEISKLKEKCGDEVVKGIASSVEKLESEIYGIFDREV